MSGMKSAYELAMERFGGDSKPLTEKQKEAISKIDTRLKARIAEIRIMADQQLANEMDPAKAAMAEQARNEQIAKATAEAEAEKEAVRREA